MAKTISKVPVRDEQSFIETIVEVIQSEGFDFGRLSKREAPLDLVLVAADGSEIGIEATFGGRFESDAAVRRVLRGVMAAYGPLRIRELMIVSPSFSPKERDVLDAHHGIEMVELKRLRSFVQRYKPKRPRTRAPGSTIKVNREKIVLAAAALASLIDEKLASLQQQKPNSPESITARDTAISDYEKLKAKVDALRAAVDKFTEGRITEPAVAKTANSFGEGVSKWWAKRHDGILTTGYNTGIFLSAVALCSLVGVNPTFAAGVTGALVGGKTVAGALKSLPKRLP